MEKIALLTITNATNVGVSFGVQSSSRKLCGHRCIGLSGEPCSTKCRVCHRETTDVITLKSPDELKESDRFVQLEDCQHIFEVSGLDIWIDPCEAEQSDGSWAIKLKKCPGCRTPIWRSHRYSNIVKTNNHQEDEVKKKIAGHENTTQGNFRLDTGNHIGAFTAFGRDLKQDLKVKEYEKASSHLSFRVERSSFAPSLAKLIDRCGVIETTFGRSSRKAADSLAMQAIVQWASALTLTESKKFVDAIVLCDVVLGKDPQNRLAADLKAKAKTARICSWCCNPWQRM